jgi:hypothetical protein
MASEPEVARELLGNLRLMFLLERQFADKPRKQRERMRQAKVKAIVDRHFRSLPPTPAGRARRHAAGGCDPLLAQSRASPAAILGRRQASRHEQHFRATAAPSGYWKKKLVVYWE